MTEKENYDFLIEFEKNDDVTRIRISGVTKSKFDDAYRLANHLTTRAKEIDIELEEERTIQIAQKQVEYLWNQDGSVWKLDASISDASYRIALTLLRTHPECKKQIEVINETGVAKMTVSDNLSGKVRSTRQYFHKCEKGHKLSDEGLQWVVDKIIPSTSILINEIQQEDARG